MKLNNGEIFKARKPLMKLMELKLPVKTAYGLAKLTNKLLSQSQIIEDVRIGLIKTYGEEDENGKVKTKKDVNGEEVLDLSPEVTTKLNAELNELMEQEVEIVIEKVKLPEKVDERTIEIEPSVLMALQKFVEV